MTPKRRLAVPAFVCSLLVSAAAGGCSSGTADPKPPELDALTMSDTAVASKDGFPGDYDVLGKISYHDPDGVVAKIRVFGGSTPRDVELSAVSASVSDHEFGLTFQNVKPGATFDYEVAVVDNDGLESNHSKQTVHIP